MIKPEERINCNPKILGGKPVVHGTRIPVELVLKVLAQGWNYEQIIEEYPDLTREDILACITYAKDAVTGEEVRHAEAFA